MSSLGSSLGSGSSTGSSLTSGSGSGGGGSGVVSVKPKKEFHKNENQGFVLEKKQTPPLNTSKTGFCKFAEKNDRLSV